MLQSVAAGSTDTALVGRASGAAGAIGDRLDYLLVIPASTSPGAVQLKDGGGSAITLFPGGASSLSNLAPFTIYLGERSLAGPWKVTTGANVAVVASGDFH